MVPATRILPPLGSWPPAPPSAVSETAWARIVRPADSVRFPARVWTVTALLTPLAASRPARLSRSTAPPVSRLSEPPA